MFENPDYSHLIQRWLHIYLRGFFFLSRNRITGLPAIDAFPSQTQHDSQLLAASPFELERINEQKKEERAQTLCKHT